MTRVLLATGTSATRDAAAHAAALAVTAARSGNGPALLVSLESDPRRRAATLLAAPEARRLEAELRDRGAGEAVARGHFCQLPLPAGIESLTALTALLEGQDAGIGTAVVQVPVALWTEALGEAGPPVSGGMLRADLPRDRALAALVVEELRGRGLRARVATRALGRIAARRALAGVDPGGVASSRTARLARGLLNGSRGQALPAMLGTSLALIVTALALVAIGGAVTGVGRAQRAADLAAVSAARSLRDDSPRLLAPSRLPDGSPNPRHIDKPTLLARAGAAGRDAADRNGVSAARLLVEFPDARKAVPIRARVQVSGEVRDLPPAPDGAPRPPIPVVARATAEAAPPAGSWTGMPETASGGGYSGPLAYRQNEGMRPDVATAFDRMAAAARAVGVALTISSAFRSDAEQAILFAAHPDPTWVAPPGHSLHRCATELDLGPSSAYGWLAANASRFGFLKRYSWVLADLAKASIHSSGAGG
ncbi:MAG: D-alanyl-D-alanine carboxypeptidase family protein, partial [Solirubrobacterales bacterium]